MTAGEKTARVYRHLDEIDFRLDELPAVPRPGRVVMAQPDYFDVSYVINPHMAAHVGQVHVGQAAEEWRTLRRAYESLSIPVETVAAQEGLPDLVFCANQTLPYYRPDSGERGVVLSRMHAPQRREEVPHFARFFKGIGYEVAQLADPTLEFEGMGDAIWHPGRHLLWGGYGHRTSLAAYRAISERLNVRILALRLPDERFYHLDTCFSILDDRHVLVYPDALDEDGLAIIRAFFEHVIEAPEDEALGRFACNAHCPDGEHVLIQRGCRLTNHRLEERGFTPVEVDTDEFLKSGGSVFCMKQMIW